MFCARKEPSWTSPNPLIVRWFFFYGISFYYLLTLDTNVSVHVNLQYCATMICVGPSVRLCAHCNPTSDRCVTLHSFISWINVLTSSWNWNIIFYLRPMKKNHIDLKRVSAKILVFIEVKVKQIQKHCPGLLQKKIIWLSPLMYEMLLQ